MLEEAIETDNEIRAKIKNGDFSKEARLVLRTMQMRDYRLLSLNMDCA